MPDTIRMRALQSRSASQSPTGKALARGDEFDATPQQARDCAARGFAERVKATPAKASAK